MKYKSVVKNYNIAVRLYKHVVSVIENLNENCYYHSKPAIDVTVLKDAKDDLISNVEKKDPIAKLKEMLDDIQ